MGLDPQYQEVDRTIDDYHQRVLGVLAEVCDPNRAFERIL